MIGEAAAKEPHVCDSGSYDAAVSKAGARAPCILRDRCGGDARGRFVRPMLISDMSTVRLMVVDGRAWTGKAFSSWIGRRYSAVSGTLQYCISSRMKLQSLHIICA